MASPVPDCPPPTTGWGSVVAPARAAPTHSVRRYPELDTQRGLAVVAFVVFTVYQFCNVNHFLYAGTFSFYLLNSFDAAIPWFFVLTAFLLFEPVARAVISGAPIWSSRRALTRRAVSMLPVYYIAVTVVWFFRQTSLPGDWRDLLEHLTFTQVFDEKRIFYTNGPAWAVSVAVFFFLVLITLSPVLTRIGARLPNRTHRIALLAGVAGVLGAVSLVWKTWFFAVEHRQTTGSFTTWFGPHANLDIFAIGMLVAVWSAAVRDRDGPPLSLPARATLRLAGLAILVFAFFMRAANSWSAVYFGSLCSLGFGAFVAAAVLGPRRPHSGAAARRYPLAWLGAISYSIYLWHEPLLLALSSPDGLIRQTPAAFVPDTTVVLVSAVLAGWLSYVLLERPSKKLGAFVGRNIWADRDTT